jgi:hypothetical protein
MLHIDPHGNAYLSFEQRSAITEAQRGNWKAADTLELERLRLLKPHDEDGETCPFKVRPVEILRNSGPDAEDVARWELETTCEPCCGTGWRIDDDAVEQGICAACDGLGKDWSHELITDLDGLILEADLP